MNLVAHQILSFNIEKIRIGNFLGEFVRGKNYENYEPTIAKGIILHRNIDFYTDNHPLVKQASSLFSLSQGKFAPIVVDVIFDYFLIKNWHLFHQIDYSDFTSETYNLLKKYSILYTDLITNYLDTMILENWFKRYETLEGIELTLSEISKRAKFTNHIQTSIKELYLNEDKLEQIFLNFFDDLLNFAKNRLQNL